MPRIALVVASALLLCACPSSEPELVTGLPNEPGGNPLVPDVALYPWPSDLYLVDDASTETGRRLELPDEALPDGLSASSFAADDGFTRVPAMLAFFREGIDPATLPDASDEGATTSPDSPVLLVEEGTWRLIPLLAELDLNARGAFEQALILRPHHVLRPDTGYAVLLRDSLKGAAGEDIAVGRAFAALREGLPTDDAAVEAMRDDFQLVLDAAAQTGVDPAELILGWTFHTRSEDQVTLPLRTMQEAMMTADLPPFELISEGQDGDDYTIVGTFEVPYFLDSDHRLHVDDDGLPVQQGSADIEFVLAVPDTITEPAPVICYGHGFFSTKERVLSGSYSRLLHERRYASIALDFRGFTEADIGDTVPILSGELDRVPEIAFRQLQNVANFTLMARLVEEQLAGYATVGDRLDGDNVHYMGISNGGTQGLTIMTTSPYFERGVLVVPGGGWSHMLQRAVQWTLMAGFLEDAYPPLELQVTMSMIQQFLDYADSLNYVEHLVTDRWDGRDGEVAVTLHEAVDDAQVANLVTHWVARSAGIPLVTPSPLDVYGLEPVAAAPPDGYDGDSALLVYDLGVEPPPEGNVPPETDSGSHGLIRELDVYVEHVGAFLDDGTIVQVCDGACDPE